MGKRFFYCLITFQPSSNKDDMNNMLYVPLLVCLNLWIPDRWERERDWGMYRLYRWPSLSTPNEEDRKWTWKSRSSIVYRLSVVRSVIEESQCVCQSWSLATETAFDFPTPTSHRSWSCGKHCPFLRWSGSIKHHEHHEHHEHHDLMDSMTIEGTDLSTFPWELVGHGVNQIEGIVLWNCEVAVS